MADTYVQKFGTTWAVKVGGSAISPAELAKIAAGHDEALHRAMRCVAGEELKAGDCVMIDPASRVAFRSRP